MGEGVFKKDTIAPKPSFDPHVAVIAQGTNDYYFYNSYDGIRAHCKSYPS